MSSLEKLASQATQLAAKLASEPDSAAQHVAFLGETCSKLQENNRQLKNFIAELDAVAAHDAMKGNFLGLGAHDAL